MRKSIGILIMALAFASCKTKQAVVPEQAVTAETARSAKEVIDGHNRIPKDFQTLYIKADASYKDSKQSQNVSADIRIKKGEMILVSVRFLGITMAKALITPKKVSYYEKINNTYFEGNYAMLSRWLGTELNYDKVQNMLLGEALDNLEKGNYQMAVENGQYKLQGKEAKGINKELFFEGANFLLKKQVVAQGGQEPRSLDIQYPAHKEYPKAVLPAEIKIEAEQKDRVNLKIEYNSVTFDEKLSFPYDVPEGYEQIFID
ncbi:DUF4292 domain-containing protein [Flavobacterium album]|uniref:DUF4292 domain-containing protein n=1 Tax=Flavobacterium album TaxID=2175091 RepID=A0A2S1QVR6_9FLAO|nr:DUF4292 domain-containing protein [Flavobacterium album]AWH84484.1 DUF4292 domain-containing protein [Flavobacterium album]